MGKTLSLLQERMRTPGPPGDGVGETLHAGHQTMLGKAITESQASKRQAVETVSADAALKPTDSEIEVSAKLVQDMSNRYSGEIAKHGLTEEIKERMTADVKAYIDELQRKNDMSFEAAERLKKIVLSSMFGLGPLEPFMQAGSGVTDIIVLKWDHICVEDPTGMHRVNAAFNSEQDLRNKMNYIAQSVGRELNSTTPFVDARLSDGSRVHMAISPSSPDGPTMTIRRFNNKKLTPMEYLVKNTLTPEMLDFLEFCVKSRLNIIVSGGTGSGKTTLLNMLSGFIPENEQIITIEDNCELQLRQPNVRRLEAREGEGNLRITIQDLVRQSLRMRPDRIIVGEIRDGCVSDMLNAMSTGHEGSMSTVHADSPEILVGSRLPSLFGMNTQASFTEQTQNVMISNIHIIVQISREPDYTRKITKITAMDKDPRDNTIVLTDLYVFQRGDGTFIRTNGIPNKLIDILNEKGIQFPNRFMPQANRQEGTE